MMIRNFNFFLTMICSLVLVTSCSTDEIDNVPVPDPDPNASFTIYTGDLITFTKGANTDETDSANQDRINEDVWITRGEGGEIFNIKTESSSTKGSSPAGTEWAQGTTSDIDDLSFAAFRDAINPQDVVGKDLVLHLMGEDAYVDVKFTSWSSGKTGGFEYERASK